MTEKADWIPLPDVRREFHVGMITEVLDRESIPNWIRLPVGSAGMSWAAAPAKAGKTWCILVPRDYYNEALEIFEQIIGSDEL